MRTLILYYSVTGNTRKIASALAKAMNAELCEITCAAYSRGFAGPWRQAFDVLFRRSPVIEVPEQANQNWDLVIVGGPVWGVIPRHLSAAIWHAKPINADRWHCS